VTDEKEFKNQKIMIVPPNGLKGQKNSAQGNALGLLKSTSFRALKGQKLQ
jgi:hypothetical protein